MNIFNENNKITLNDVIEGLLEHREFKFTFECFGDHYKEVINSFSSLARLIKEFDYSNIKIEAL